MEYFTPLRMSRTVFARPSIFCMNPIPCLAQHSLNLDDHNSAARSYHRRTRTPEGGHNGATPPVPNGGMRASPIEGTTGRPGHLDRLRGGARRSDTAPCLAPPHVVGTAPGCAS